MNDKIDSLLPKHGEEVQFTVEKKVKDCFDKIVENYNNITVGVVLTGKQIRQQHVGIKPFLQDQGKKFSLPCRECLKTLALHASDLADALKELSEWKE